MVTRRIWVAMILVALAPMLMRLALLPWWRIPRPTIHDEFSYLYAADTFASGRLTNPAHPLWHFFEVPHVVVQPRMFSKYPPAQGMILALGQVLFGDPWFGVWLSAGVLCAAVYWMLLARVAREWALLGAVIVGSHVGLAGYWMNSFWGGNVAASAGALAIGAYLRLRTSPCPVWAALFSAGWIILAASRPYEGAVLLALPLAVSLLWRGLPWRTFAAGATVAILGGVALGVYNLAVTGQAWKLPYSVYYEQYSYVPNIYLLPLGSPPPYRQEALAMAMKFDEEVYRTMRSRQGVARLLEEWWIIARESVPRPLLLALAVFLFTGALTGSARWILALLGLGIFGLSVETFLFPHYFAPFFPLLILLVVLAIGHLRHRPRGQLYVVLLLAAAGVHQLFVLRIAARRPSLENMVVLRPQLEAYLRETYEEHLIFVRDEFLSSKIRSSWIYNRADMDTSPVIWAADLGEEENRKLIAMYPRRKAWLLPVRLPIRLEPYGAPDPLRQPVTIE
jgi:hypothetical protein